jgi:hypothetical protein
MFSNFNMYFFHYLFDIFNIKTGLFRPVSLLAHRHQSDQVQVAVQRLLLLVLGQSIFYIEFILSILFILIDIRLRTGVIIFTLHNMSN